MNLSLTEDALKAIAENKSLDMLQFVAGSSKSIDDMRRWLSNPYNYMGIYDYYAYPVEAFHFYAKGEEYPGPDGPAVADSNFMRIQGTLDCSEVGTSFAMRSLAVTAMVHGGTSSFIYAYGSIGPNDSFYPVNNSDGVTYVTPVKIIYDTIPNTVSSEAGVPYRDFAEHTDTYVSTSEGAHGLKIDPTAMTMTVGDTTISLAGGEERVAELEQEVQGILKYQSSDSTITYNDQLVLTVLTPADGDGTANKPYKIRTPLDFWVVGTFKTDSNKFFYDSTVYPEGNDQSYYYPNEHYSLEDNLDLYPLIGVKKKSPSDATPGITPANLIDELKPIPSAPCYNNGRGYESWGLVSSNSYFYGNGHIIKNLYIGPVLSTDSDYNYSKHYRRYGLFNRIGGNSCIISGITLIDSRIIVGYEYDCHVGSILSTTDNSDSCEIRNCVSYAEIEKIGKGNGSYGGIVGRMYSGLGIYFCAFRGRFTDYYNTTGYGFGGIGGGNGGSCVIGCCCDAVISLNTSGECGGIRGYWLPSTTDFVSGGNYYNGCYFAGSLSNRYNRAQLFPYAYCSAITHQDSLAIDPERLVPLKFTFSLQGSALFMQGNSRTREQMLSQSFVDELNAALPANLKVHYLYVEGQFPKLSYEVTTIPTTAPLATIDTNTNYVLDSGYTVRDLIQTATQDNLNAVNINLQSMLAQRYRVKIVNLTIQTTDWNGRRYVYYDDDLMYVNYQTQVLPIPSGQEFIDHFVTCINAGRRNINDVYRGFAEFECASLPSIDMTFPVLILY